MRKTLISLVVVACSAFESSAIRAEDELLGAARVNPSLTEEHTYSIERRLVPLLEQQLPSVKRCYDVGPETSARWDGVLQRGKLLSSSITALDLAYAGRRVETANAAVIQATGDALERAKSEQKAASEAFEVLNKTSGPQQAGAPPTTAEDATKQVGAAAKQADTARNEFVRALVTAENAARSPKDFRRAVNDPERVEACKAYRAAFNVAVRSQQPAALEPSPAKEQAQIEAATVKARLEDAIGKTTATTSAVTGSSNLVEQPGAPERIVYTVMSALGADSETTGTQLLMTLNLASAVASSDTKPVQNPFLRNLFLRVGLPLEVTEGKSQADDPESAPETDAPEVSRMTFVVGGSLLDESDPRLHTGDECFQFVKAYIPPTLDEAESRNRVRERQLYYASCAQIVANRQRLAWRVGLGTLTTKEESRQRTKPEVVAAALVYGPTDWLLFNAIGQRFLQPYKVNTVGGGFSAILDAGGDQPGGQWGRLSIDALGFAQFREKDDEASISRSKEWEARVAVTGSGKVVTGGVAQFSLGPRIFSSGEVGLFSTVALTYDADNLIHSLLTPLPETAAK
ncbi:MAG TPA: hypothetical protein VJN18_11565 [Polyangiaceae bacterium]|nr:hypothetical protein [Polyangiaceae bacterium]